MFIGVTSLLISAKVWKKKTPLSLVLLPLSIIFFSLIFIRKKLLVWRVSRRQDRIKGPTIIVGNITAGGTGKTPLVIYLANELTARGLHPGIISRGYGRETQDIYEVMRNSSPVQVGDEPCIIVQQVKDCPVFVGKNKHQVAKVLLQRYPMVNIIISDDGLQHYSLERDIEICLIDGDNPFGNGFLLPAGPLREPKSRLKLVDFIVTKNSLTQLHENIPTFKMQLNGTTIINLKNRQIREPLSYLKNKSFNAVAGIGNPHHFFQLLQKYNLKFQSFSFSDHHIFTPNDLDFNNSDPVLMTEKDAIKCNRFAHDNWWMLPVKAKVENNFIEKIMEKIQDKYEY